MTNATSKLEASRQQGINQVDDQRTNILDSAEKLFLEKGLEKTNMKEIAEAAGISRVSLYRYFPDMHPIAFEIAVRMMKEISLTITARKGNSALEIYRASMLTAIDKFYELQDAFRFMGMFDHLYGENYPNQELTTWYKEQLYELPLGLSMEALQSGTSDIPLEQIVMIGNSVMSFLQKMAVRGELMTEEQEVAVNTQLAHFKTMLNIYFDHLLDQKQA